MIQTIWNKIASHVKQFCSSWQGNNFMWSKIAFHIWKYLLHGQCPCRRRQISCMVWQLNLSLWDDFEGLQERPVDICLPLGLQLLHVAGCCLAIKIRQILLHLDILWSEILEIMVCGQIYKEKNSPQYFPERQVWLPPPPPAPTLSRSSQSRWLW